MCYASIRDCGFFYTTLMFDSLGRIKAQRKEMRSFLIFCVCIALSLYIFSPSHKTDFSLSAKECANLNMLWQTQYQNDFQFDDTWSFAPFECGSTDAKMAHALFLIDTMKSTGSKNFDFYNWIKDVDPVFSRRLMFGYSGASYFGAHRADLNIDKLRITNPVEIAGIVIHETRHLDQGYNSHVPCKTDHKNQCDIRLQADPLKGGAYNYNVIFYQQLQQDKSATRSVKYIASKLLKSTLETKFNQSVAQKRF